MTDTTLTEEDFRADAERTEAVTVFGREFFDWLNGRVSANDHFFCDTLFEWFDVWFSLLMLELRLTFDRCEREFFKHLVSAETARLINTP